MNLAPLSILALVIAPEIAWAQAAAFDVASLKPVRLTPGDLYTANLGSFRNGQIALSNVTLADCLKFAYSISNDSQIEGPHWIKSKDVRFDIAATTSPEAPREQALEMLQTLLNERFELDLRHEQKELSHLALVPGKKSHKMPVAKEGPPAFPSIHRGNSIVNAHLSMPVMATLLSRFLRQAVIDNTGLSGFFEVHLEWTPSNFASDASPDAPSGPSIFTAVQEQLGLKLESKKAPLDVLVIHKARKEPIEN